MTTTKFDPLDKTCIERMSYDAALFTIIEISKMAREAAGKARANLSGREYLEMFANSLENCVVNIMGSKAP